MANDGDDEDRAAIRERRAMLVAAALAGLSSSFAGDAEAQRRRARPEPPRPLPAACLSPMSPRCYRGPRDTREPDVYETEASGALCDIDARSTTRAPFVSRSAAGNVTAAEVPAALYALLPRVGILAASGSAASLPWLATLSDYGDVVAFEGSQWGARAVEPGARRITGSLDALEATRVFETGARAWRAAQGARPTGAPWSYRALVLMRSGAQLFALTSDDGAFGPATAAVLEAMHAQFARVRLGGPAAP